MSFEQDVMNAVMVKMANLGIDPAQAGLPPVAPEATPPAPIMDPAMAAPAAVPPGALGLMEQHPYLTGTAAALGTIGTGLAAMKYGPRAWDGVRRMAGAYNPERYAMNELGQYVRI